MAGVQPAGGVLIAQYLIGLACLVGGLALLLLGIYRGAPPLTVLGIGLSVLGVLLVALKIMMRNRPPD